MQARRADTDANTLDDIGFAGALALESIASAHKGNRAAEADALEAAGSALSRLPLMVLTHGGPVTSLAVLSDGRLASGGADGEIKLWPKDGTGEPVVLTHGGTVTSLAELSDGRLASGGEDGKIKLWLVREEKLLAALCLRPVEILARTSGLVISAPALPGNQAAATGPQIGGHQIKLTGCGKRACVGEAWVWTKD
jgi:WD40 repeat protein